VGDSEWSSGFGRLGSGGEREGGGGVRWRRVVENQPPTLRGKNERRPDKEEGRKLC